MNGIEKVFLEFWRDQGKWGFIFTCRQDINRCWRVKGVGESKPSGPFPVNLQLVVSSTSIINVLYTVYA